jgi:DNA polymerase/3'-5' exonuclease PolX
MLLEMNQTIIAGFNELISVESNKFKVISYKKAISIISQFPTKIISSSELEGIKGIGSGLIKHIDTFLSNKCINNDLTDLLRITGIGPVKAKKLIDDGYTLQKLLDYDVSTLTGVLTHHQLLGVKHFHDLEKRIPYSDIKKIEGYLKSRTKQDLVICGSYRRKKETSGDVDVLIYNGDGLRTFLNALVKDKFLVDHLTSLEKSTTKYMGMCRYGNTVRRIDIRFIPIEHLPSALLYFTGSGEFNKRMRKEALKCGYTINEYGIYKLDTEGNKGDLVHVSNEEDIFKVIGMDYLEPHLRVK